MLDACIAGYAIGGDIDIRLLGYYIIAGVVYTLVNTVVVVYGAITLLLAVVIGFIIGMASLALQVIAITLATYWLTWLPL